MEKKLKNYEKPWTKKQVEKINAEMAEGVIHEIGEVLGRVGCFHGNDVKSTPPMFYPEMILCAVTHAREEGKRIGRRRALSQGRK